MTPQETPANSLAAYPASTASDRLDMMDDDDCDRQFCDGGVFVAALGNRKCWKCGAGPDDECGAEPVPEIIER